LYDCEFPYEPYPEVISYEKLQDGTLKLTIEAVWEIRMLDQAITSELMIKSMVIWSKNRKAEHKKNTAFAVFFIYKKLFISSNLEYHFI
jgi:hypothetical protein